MRCALSSAPLTMLINLMVVDTRERVAMGDKDVECGEATRSKVGGGGGGGQKWGKLIGRCAVLRAETEKREPPEMTKRLSLNFVSTFD